MGTLIRTFINNSSQEIMKFIINKNCNFKQLSIKESSLIKVDNAITLQKKKETVKKLKSYLEKSILAVNIKFQGVTVAELQEFRTSLPSDAYFIIAKNSLIRIASRETHGWSDLGKLA